MVLLWLLPALVVTLAAMVWVAWLGRETRGEVDREEALRKMSRALETDGPRRPWQRPPRPVRGYAVAPREQDRSTGVARRADVEPEAGPDSGEERRAS